MKPTIEKITLNENDTVTFVFQWKYSRGRTNPIRRKQMTFPRRHVEAALRAAKMVAPWDAAESFCSCGCSPEIHRQGVCALCSHRAENASPDKPE